MRPLSKVERVVECSTHAHMNDIFLADRWVVSHDHGGRLHEIRQLIYDRLDHLR